MFSDPSQSKVTNKDSPAKKVEDRPKLESVQP